MARYKVDIPTQLKPAEAFELMRQQCGLEPSGFFPVGSGSPLCNAYGRVAYIDGQWRHALKDLTVDDFMDLMGDDPVDFVRALTVGLSESVPYMAKQVMKNPRLLKKVVPLVGNDPLGWLRGKKGAKQTTIYIKPFMDASDLDIDRIDACRSISGEAGTCTHPRARNWDAVSHQSSRPFAGRTDPSR